MTSRLLLSLLLVASLLLVGCSEDEPPITVSLEKRQEISIQPRQPAITYAYLPQYSHTESFQRHHQLVEYLSEATGLPVRQVFPDTFDHHLSMFGQGEIDVSFSNPFIYVKLANRYGARAMARIIEKNGRAEFRGQIIARRDNDRITSLADCRGKSWVAVDPSSAGGYLFPLGHFFDHGLRLDDFREVVFAGGRQENVILGVYAGLHDIGSIREGSLQVVAGKIDLGQLKVIDHSPWYPGWVYAHSPRLSADTVDLIRNALLALDYQNNAQHRAILDAANFIGFVPSDDQDFDRIRTLSQKVGLNLD
ncbi:phosphate/phosphite/phosphonate ABC transporter substrate-binding protein [Desulfofustis limnaeus]|jgi:phosphonate transport system substrate-binding protein|uniref:Phosphonate ABC transporter substrate-binding protein n=1 Tax=Desulfofustis limnaeus TaxID=2740163 RepID=A0ABN6MCM0_9BACT|nr:phosphate/phosphite/phosphonate ABC transporter substrate-binding protein [Desulfofustis limnaeus]MDX9894888.1 phosphate/phosphite/phosphonate ABC transporter substrate-binding protein [Desulfofustis sp.]BDD89323.1 phosphonate ABC transporter substrate-binding protein [Desulfofustis limnaeus]